jgi:ABC transporter substrate binding protein
MRRRVEVHRHILLLCKAVEPAPADGNDAKILLHVGFGWRSVTDAYRQAGVYVARVLRGEKPGELPVMQAAKFEFVLNLKTAKTLAIDVPMAFSAAADEIIE